ncbi:hypothetical protein SPLC1_S533440 [Arthrospira platensis C1]|nr:hypothetical protein SPLC1_S533440 [Arthrospira platensis C1]
MAAFLMDNQLGSMVALRTCYAICLSPQSGLGVAIA